MRRLFRIILMITSAFAVEAHAAGAGYSAHEVAALPEYCPYTQGFRDQFGGGNAEAASYWGQQLGPEAMHMHHYCRGILFINRARGSMPKERGKWYGLAIGELDYILRNVKEDYVLLPEMLTRKGEALVHLKNFVEAQPVLRKAIELKPDYWPAYARLAEGFIILKQPDAAREVLKEGIARADDPRGLQRMLDELGNQRR